MASATPTWAIPYAQSTDQMCDGWLYIQEMAERVDEILDEFDVDLAASQVVQLARASRIDEPVQVNVSTGEVIFTAIDFDTAGLANVFTPTDPIRIDEESLWMLGGMLYFDFTGSGTLAIRVNTASSIAFSNYIWRQRTTGASTDMAGTVAFMATISDTFDRINTSGTPSIDVARAFVWAWRIGVNPT